MNHVNSRFKSALTGRVRQLTDMLGVTLSQQKTRKAATIIFKQ